MEQIGQSKWCLEVSLFKRGGSSFRLYEDIHDKDLNIFRIICDNDAFICTCRIDRLYQIARKTVHQITN